MKLNLARIGATAFSLGVRVRTIWLTFLVGVLSGCLLMLAWIATVKFATETALSLIARANALI